RNRVSSKAMIFMLIVYHKRSFSETEGQKRVSQPETLNGYGSLLQGLTLTKPCSYFYRYNVEFKKS
ncbi:MAG: hypothetical protein AAF202_03925, partial [Pseudomonadota bacterium]